MILDYLCLLKSVKLASLIANADWPKEERGMCLRFALATLQTDWLSPTELARRTGYHRTTMTNAVSELRQRGWLIGEKIISIPDALYVDDKRLIIYATIPVPSADCPLSFSANRLLWKIAAFSWNGGHCTATFKGLAGMLGVSPKRIAEDYAQLKYLNLINDPFGIKEPNTEVIMSRFNWWESSVKGIEASELKQRCDWVRCLLVAAGVNKPEINFCKQVVVRLPSTPSKDSHHNWAETVGYAIMDATRQTDAEDKRYQPAVLSRLDSLEEGQRFYTREYTPTDELIAVTPERCRAAHKRYLNSCDQAEAEYIADVNDATPINYKHAYADTFNRLEAEDKAIADRLKALREIYKPVFLECFERKNKREKLDITLPAVRVWLLCEVRIRSQWIDNSCSALREYRARGVNISDDDIAVAQDETIHKIWDEAAKEAV